MREVLIKKPNKIYLNSFRPLCMTEIGRNAVERHQHPPFIDASCRREPDFENTFPTISSICRGGHFAPRLRENDIIVYLTVKKRYYNDEIDNNKLIAILQVDKVFNTHQEGFEWFLQEGKGIPSNCIVEGNIPFEFNHTASRFETKSKIKEFLSKSAAEQIVQGRRILRDWDRYYKEKVDKWQMFVKTRPLYIELKSPVPLYNEDMHLIFSEKIPNTRNPPKITFPQLELLSSLIGIKLVTE